MKAKMSLFYRKKHKILCICTSAAIGFVTVFSVIFNVDHLHLSVTNKDGRVHQVVHNNSYFRSTFKPVFIQYETTAEKLTRSHSITNLSHIYITIKTTAANHKDRLRLLLATWIRYASNQVHMFCKYN